MNKLFKYELRRLLVNKFFPGLLLVCIFYSSQLLEKSVILGVANTAPFSGWSYGYYLSSLMPVLLIALLFFISFWYSPKERRVQAVTNATPTDPNRIKQLRGGAILAGMFLLTAAPVSLSLIFYKVNFHFTAFGDFFVPALMTLVPAILFILGMGMTLGRIHPAFIYGLMVLVLLWSALPLPAPLDLTGRWFFQDYPETAAMWADGEPAFKVPANVWMWKAFYSLAGILLIVFRPHRHIKKTVCK